MSYFDIEGEFVYQDFYNLKFDVCLYKQNITLNLNSDEDVIFYKQTIYEINVRISFYKKILSPVADL